MAEEYPIVYPYTTSLYTHVMIDIEVAFFLGYWNLTEMNTEGHIF